MLCRQIRALEQMSKYFNLGAISDEVFFALRKTKSGIVLKQKDLTSLDEALKYVNLIEDGYRYNQEFKKSGTIHVNSRNQKQLRAFNLYLQFARERGVTDTDIQDSIKTIREAIRKVRDNEHTERKELEHAEKFFSYLLKYSLNRFDEVLYG